MSESGRNRHWVRMAIAAMLGLAVVMGGSGTDARANDDEDVAPDTKFLRKVLSVLGLRRDGEAIDYSERSPLVLPPSRELRAPERGAAAPVAGWPNDPDVRRARQRAEQEKNRKTVEEEENPLPPSELDRPGPVSPASRPDGKDRSWDTVSRPSTPAELGSKNVFSTMFGRPKEEYATFTSEPARGSLTEPPAGYRTPSPHQPYGVGKQTWKPGPRQDRHEDR
jgi:hypothetical protein